MPRQTVTPALTVDDADAAIAFYQKVFGAQETTARLTDPDGKVFYVELRIGDTQLVLGDAFPSYGNQSPLTIGGTPVRMSLYVDDVDAVVERAVDVGAEVLIPVADQFYGDRAGRLRDPFGHEWIVSTHVEDVSTEEMQRRCDAAYAGG